MGKALKVPTAARNGAAREISHGMEQLHEISRSWVEYRPAEARAILQDSRHPNQRRVSWKHVDFLADQMVRGEFSCLGNEIVFATRQPGGERWMVDGQHRLLAIIRTGLPQRLQTVDLEGPEGAIHAFYYHIDRGRPRNGLGDCVPTEEIASAMGVSSTFLKRCRSAIKSICLGLTGEGVTSHKNWAAVRDTRSMLAAEQLYSDTIRVAREEVFAENIRDSREAGSATRLLGFPSLSIVLGTIRYAPEQAIPFWREVASGSRSRGTISRDLADWLLSAMGNNDNDIRRRKMLAAALAWNDHAVGRRRSDFKSAIRALSRQTKNAGVSVLDLSEWLATGNLEGTPLAPSMDVAADPSLQAIIEAGLPAANQTRKEGNE